MRLSNKKYLLMRRITLISRLMWEALLYTVTIASALVLVFVYAAAMVDPTDTAWFVPFALAAPVIFVVNLFWTLFWTIRWKSIALVPLLLLLAGIPVIARHVQIPLFQHYAQEQRSDLKLMSYNVHTFHNPSWHWSADSIARFIKMTSPDIVALQEYYSTSTKTADSLRHIMSGYPHISIHYIRKESPDAGFGLAIFSRHKIVDTHKIPFNDNNGAMYADLLIDRDTIRLFNCHLQTTNITDNDISFVKSGARSHHEASFGNILAKIKDNSVKRARQAGVIADLISESPYPVVVCGDFNDVPASYTYTRMSKGLKDCFKRAGRGYAHSFHDFFEVFNVDYIMYDPQRFKCVYYNSPSLSFSDHNPVIVRLKAAEKK